MMRLIGDRRDAKEDDDRKDTEDAERMSYLELLMVSLFKDRDLEFS